MTCIFRTIFNFPCPTCGVTRALISLLKGDFSAYCYFNVMAVHCVFIHRDEHIQIHRSKLSYSKYSVLNDRNLPVQENQSELAQAIRREREINKKRV